MMRETVVPLIVIAAVAAAGWHFREPLQQQLSKAQASMPALSGQQPELPAPVPHSQTTPHKETVYRWVDENGRIHYGQQPTPGSEAVVLDQSHLQTFKRYGEPTLDANGTPLVEANGDAPQEGSR